MILPILAYGAAVLRMPGRVVTPEEPGLQKLIADMWQTLDNAGGVGLAAQQVNKALLLFLVDSTNAADDGGIRQVFINARILEYSKAACSDTEGCLSIPGIWEEVTRAERITIAYEDEHFIKHTRVFDGVTARMIQHEYDHTQGKLYLDYLKPLRKKLLQGKLQSVMKGRVESGYPMKF
jgi:peptide deformylase